MPPPQITGISLGMETGSDAIHVLLISNACFSIQDQFLVWKMYSEIEYYLDNVVYKYFFSVITFFFVHSAVNIQATVHAFITIICTGCKLVKSTSLSISHIAAII